MDLALLQAIASPRRREILRLLWNEEQTAGAIHRAMPDVTWSDRRRVTASPAGSANGGS